jgi:hypothetical protein
MTLDIGIIRKNVGKKNNMKTELELELVKKYPKILSEYGGDPTQTCLSWGVEHDDGWFKLLDKCMEKLQYFCDLCSKDGEEVQVVANQIKEKYGTLSFYTSVYGGDNIQHDIIDDIIDTAERKSAYTCEVTGEHGELCKKGGWYRTLCYEQARKYGYVACKEATEEYWQEKDKKGSSI